ncbi:hypothetical protein CJ430_31675, partial [Klebsiella pneumoniae]
TELAENRFHADIAAIFAGHHTLLDDDDLFDAANDRLLTELAENRFHADIAAIFAGHHTLLDDDDLFDAAN